MGIYDDCMKTTFRHGLTSSGWVFSGTQRAYPELKIMTFHEDLQDGDALDARLRIQSHGVHIYVYLIKQFVTL